MKNPQAFQQYEKIRKSNNPQEFLDKITRSYTPEQLQQFKKFVNGFGISNEQLQQFGINSR
jgi:hypothetical protein